MKLKKLDKNEKYYDGRLKYLGDVSKFEFINLFADRLQINEDELIKQFTKLREEFYECMAEVVYKPDFNLNAMKFRNELFDLINAGINLMHCMDIYYKNDKDESIYHHYNVHVNKINQRLLNLQYNWGIKLNIEGRDLNGI